MQGKHIPWIGNLGLTYPMVHDKKAVFSGQCDCGVNHTGNVLSAWLHITDRCNMRCAYCYLPHGHADMPLEIGIAVIRAIFRSARIHGYQHVLIKYAGGEPLLRFDVVVQLNKFAIELSKEDGISFDSVILTNGTLLHPNMVRQMKSLDMNLMISLDGLDSNNDCQRSFSDKGGSFHFISQAIDLTVANNLIPKISITVSARNAKGLPDFVAWILDRNLPFNINFYREHCMDQKKSDLRLEEETIVTSMIATYKIIESNLPQRSLMHSLSDYVDLSTPHVYPCGAGYSYLVFDPHGGIAKCQMEIGKTITHVDAPDPLIKIRDSKKGVQNMSVMEKSECRECEWRYGCAGGCPLLTHYRTGRFELKSPNCRIYKTLFPEIIRLEQKRLIKKHLGVALLGRFRTLVITRS